MWAAPPAGPPKGQISFDFFSQYSHSQRKSNACITTVPLFFNQEISIEKLQCWCWGDSTLGMASVAHQSGGELQRKREKREKGSTAIPWVSNGLETPERPVKRQGACKAMPRRAEAQAGLRFCGGLQRPLLSSQRRKNPRKIL